MRAQRPQAYAHSCTFMLCYVILVPANPDIHGNWPLKQWLNFNGACNHTWVVTIACCVLMQQIRLHVWIFDNFNDPWGAGVKGLTRGMATLPQGNQEPLVLKDKVGRPPGELGVSKSMECVNVISFPSVLWHCWLGDRKDIRPVKSWVMVCWWWRFDRRFARLIASAAVGCRYHLRHHYLQ